MVGSASRTQKLNSLPSAQAQSPPGTTFSHTESVATVSVAGSVASATVSVAGSVASAAAGSLVGGEVALPEPAVSPITTPATTTNAVAFPERIDVPPCSAAAADRSSAIGDHGTADVVGPAAVVVAAVVAGAAAVVVVGAAAAVVVFTTVVAVVGAAASLVGGAATETRNAMTASIWEYGQPSGRSVGSGGSSSIVWRLSPD